MSSANSAKKPYIEVTYTIPKADTPSVKAYHNGDSTGFFNISWKKLKAPKAIKSGFITGKNIRPFRSAMQPLGAQKEKTSGRQKRKSTPANISRIQTEKAEVN